MQNTRLLNGDCQGSARARQLTNLSRGAWRTWKLSERSWWNWSEKRNQSAWSSTSWARAARVRRARTRQRRRRIHEFDLCYTTNHDCPACPCPRSAVRVLLATSVPWPAISRSVVEHALRRACRVDQAATKASKIAQCIL